MDMLSQGVTREMYENLYLNSELTMMWHCRSDPRFSYHTYIPKTLYQTPSPTFQVMCFVHGTGRTFETYRDLFSGFADKNNLILLFPLFPGGLLETGDFNSYKLISYHGVRYDQILLSMIDELSERYPVRKEKIFLYGWSGGGQFAHRFLYIHPERLAAVVAGAPGRITYLDDTEDYYWGTRDFEKYFDKKIDLEAVKKVPVKLMIGQYDTKFVGESPRGNTRMERLLSLKDNYEKHGIPVSLEVIDGFEHKGFDEKKAPVVMDFFQQIIDGTKSDQT